MGEGAPIWGIIFVLLIHLCIGIFVGFSSPWGFPRINLCVILCGCACLFFQWSFCLWLWCYDAKCFRYYITIEKLTKDWNPTGSNPLWVDCHYFLPYPRLLDALGCFLPVHKRLKSNGLRSNPRPELTHGCSNPPQCASLSQPVHPSSPSFLQPLVGFQWFVSNGSMLH